MQIFEVEPNLYKECHDLIGKNVHGKFEVLAHSMYVYGDTLVEHYDDHEDVSAPLPRETPDSVGELSEKMQKQTIAPRGGQQKQNRCSTCNVSFGDATQYREHHKSDWHKHNIKRKTRQLPPLTEEECMADMELGDTRADLKDYLF